MSNASHASPAAGRHARPPVVASPPGPRLTVVPTAPGGRRSARPSQPSQPSPPSREAWQGGRRWLGGAAGVALLAAGFAAGGLVGHASRDDEVAGLHSDVTAQRAAAVDAERVAEDQADRAADAGGDTYAATALAKHSAAGAERAVARTRRAESTAAACRAAMQVEAANVDALLDILNHDDPTYTVKRLEAVDADSPGIRSCLGEGVDHLDPSVHPDEPADAPTTVLARTAAAH